MSSLPAAPAAAAAPETRWPESAPSEDEEHIVSIVCGNSHLHWAFHNGVQDNLAPSLFWRTPHLTEKDLLEGDAAESLSRHLPQFAHDYIFGDAKESTKEDAIKKSKERKVELLSVYLISTNSDQIGFLSRMWKSVPCRVCCLKGDDFFTKEEGRYDGMGVDRLATLLGAADIHGYPALVFDGGTATTYTAADSAGRIIGGGIGPGLQVKLMSLSEYTDALPRIEPDEVTRRAQDAVANKSPLPLFANNTKEAIMVEVLAELALSGRNVIKKWLKMFPSSSKSGTSGLSENKERAVVVTGGDGEILAQLFQNDHGGIVEADKSRTLTESYEIMHAKHLVHYGIQAALMKQIRVCRKQKILSDRKKLEEIVGKRVAKVFPEPDSDGDYIFRGSISKIDEAKGDDGEDVVFSIAYDDGDKEDVEYDELQEMFKLYLEKGEKGTGKSMAKKEKKGAKGASEKADSSSSQKRGKKRGAPAPENLKPALPVPKAKRSKGKLVIGDPKKYIGTRIGKFFDGTCYFGTIGSHRIDDEDLWHVRYDDGDEEELEVKELRKALKVYEKNQEKDSSPVDKKNTLVYDGSEAKPAVEGDDGAKTDKATEVKDESLDADADMEDVSDPSRPSGAPPSEKQLLGESEKAVSADNKANGEVQAEVLGKESQVEEKVKDEAEANGMPAENGN